MSAPALPSILQGPAVIIYNSITYYTKTGITKNFKRDTFTVDTDADGPIDTRLRSQMTEISFQPVGQLTANADTLGKYYPYAPADIGASIFTPVGTDTVVIHTKAGQTITYPRGAITKMPNLRLKSSDTLFGDMTITCIGAPAVQETTSTWWKTVASSSFTDATFNETRIATDIYKAAWGASPFDSIGSMDGFEIEIGMDTETIMVDGYGIGDIILKGLRASAKFAPSNLTEAQVDTMLNLQNTDVILPGQSIGKTRADSSGPNLVISSDSLTATLYQVGAKDAGYVYKSGGHRFTGIEFSQRRKWTSGVAQPMWLFTVGLA